MHTKSLVVLLLVSCNILNAQPSLSLHDIMKGPDFVGHLPSQPLWSADGKSLYFNWKPDQNRLDQPYMFETASGKIRPLTLEERRQPFNARRVYNANRTKSVFVFQGDLYLTDHNSAKTLQITHTLVNENNPTFSADGQYVLYEAENNVFSWHISTGSVRQLSQFITGEKTAEAKTTDQQRWLEADQLREFEVLRERKTKSDSSKALTKLLEIKRPKAIYLGKNRISNISVSPDQKFIHYRLTPVSTDKNTDVPNYVTVDGYTTDLRGRPKVGVTGINYHLLDLRHHRRFSLCHLNPQLTRYQA